MRAFVITGPGQCRSGRQHVCADRYEIGIRNGRPGALAEQLPVPERALQVLPDTVDAALGALVEPGGNALRSVRGADLSPGQRLLVLGPGTIGLLAAQVAAAQGAEVHLLGRGRESLAFARSIGFDRVWSRETLPDLPWDAVIDASNAAELPALAADLVEPAGLADVAAALAGERPPGWGAGPKIHVDHRLPSTDQELTSCQKLTS